MSLALVILIAFGILTWFLILNLRGLKKSPDTFFGIRPYVSKKPLTATETHFYHRLVQALPDHIVLAQVQLASFLRVDKSKIGYKDYYRWFNPIAQQSVDYLICSKDFAIIAAVELDDKSHETDRAFTRDNKKNINLQAANIPLIRWHAETMPEVEHIRQTFNQHLNSTESQPANSSLWLDADEKEAFFHRSKKQTSLLPLVIGIGAFTFALFIFGNNIINNIFIHPFIQKANTQANSIQSNNELQKVIAKQQQEKLAQEEAEKQEQIAQRQLLQQQEQAKSDQVHEAALKEEAWKNYDKSRVDCTTETDVVKCGNEHIQNRKKFEQFWKNQQASQRQ